MHVCMWIGAARGPLRANPHGKTSPARLHRSFASSRCFITMALGSPLAIHPPSSLLNWHGWRRCPVESWMKLYERSCSTPVNLASRRNENLLILIHRKFAVEIGIETLLFPFFFNENPFFHPREAWERIQLKLAFWLISMDNDICIKK